MKTIYLQGVDPRLVLLGERALETGLRVYKKIPDKAEKEAVFVFDPTEKTENILPVLEKAEKGSLFLLWRTDPEIFARAEEKKIRVKNILEDKTYLLKNARETAEGVLASVIVETDRVLSDQCILVYGYGNCGQEIAKLLWLLGCEVFIWSRERGCKKALDDGFNIYPAPTKGLFMFDGVVNTVPEQIFSPELLSTLRPNTHFFQVASGTSGISEKLLKNKGILYHDLHGLPGKFSPATDADALFDVLTAVISDEKERISL